MHGFGIGVVCWRNWLGFVGFGIRNSGGNRGFQGFDSDRAKRLADLHEWLSPISPLSEYGAADFFECRCVTAALKTQSRVP